MPTRCIVTLEGFQVSHHHIVKEMTILFDELHHQHFHFNNPYNLIISPSDNRTLKWQQDHNGLALDNQNFLPYEIIGYILSRLSEKTVYCAGHQAKSFLEHYLPNTHIIDMCVDYGFKYPLVLEPSVCFIQHPYRYCTMSKARTINMALHLMDIPK